MWVLVPFRFEIEAKSHQFHVVFSIFQRNFMKMSRSSWLIPFFEDKVIELFLKNLSSQLTQWELTLKLTVGSFWGHSVTSQWTDMMTHNVSLLLSFHKFATHTVSLLWAICEITQWAHHAVVAMGSLWANQVASKWGHHEIIQMSSLWVWC